MTTKNKHVLVYFFILLKYYVLVNKYDWTDVIDYSPYVILDEEYVNSI